MNTQHSTPLHIRALATTALAVVAAVALGLGGCALDMSHLNEPRVDPRTAELRAWLKWQAYHCSKIGQLHFDAEKSLARCMGSLNGEARREIWQIRYPGTLQ